MNAPVRLLEFMQLMALLNVIVVSVLMVGVSYPFCPHSINFMTFNNPWNFPLWGRLATSRALGDFAFKQNKHLTPNKQIVTANPEIITLSIDVEVEFLVLASDGKKVFIVSVLIDR